MRRILVFNNISADGYFAAPNGSLDWFVSDDDIYKSTAASHSEIDAMLFGRKTYDMFEKFWPNAIDDSNTSPDPHSSRRSTALREMAVWINETTKLVFSRSRKQVTWKNSRLLGDFDPKKVEELKNGPGKDIIVFGSGTIVSQLTQHGLIDEYQFVVNPVLLGDGQTMIKGLPNSAKLALQEAKDFKKTGNVMLRYSRAT